MDPAGSSHGRRCGSYCPYVIKAGVRSFRQVLLIPQDSFHVQIAPSFEGVNLNTLQVAGEPVHVYHA